MGENDSIDSLENSMIETNEDLFIKLFSDDIEDESTLYLLLTNEELPQIILNYNKYCDNNNKYYEYILGLINLIQRLVRIHDEMLDLWIKSLKQTQNDILSIIFKALNNCYSKLCLPKIICDPISEMSFYEYVCYNICGFVSTLNEYQIHFVEELLFENLLSKECVCNLLASDVLCFMARQSLFPLCYDYSRLLFNISLHVDEYCFTNIVSVLTRLLPLLEEPEIQHIIKDYDIITYSKVWKHFNFSHILSSQRINDTFETIKSLIENEKSITNDNINILMNILISDEINDKTRENVCFLFAQNFLVSNETHFYCDFIELLIVLLPNASNEIILKLMARIKDIVTVNKPNIELVLVVSKFLSHISTLQMQVSFETQFIQLIIQTIQQLFQNTQHFYAKYSVLMAMTIISLKSKYITIIMECIANENIAEVLEYHLKLFKIPKNNSMDENEKNDYLQNRIVYKFKENRNEIVINGYSQNKKRKICEENESICFNEIPPNIDFNNYSIFEKIDVMENCVKTLNENRALFSTKKAKERLVTVFYEFRDIIDRLKA